MTARWCTAVLLFAQLGALLIASGAVGVVGLLSVVVAAATLGVRVPLARLFQTSPPYVLLAVLLMVKLAVAPFDVQPGLDFVNTQLTLELATYCILSQTFILFGWPGRRLPIVIPFIAGIAMVSLFNVRIDAHRGWTRDGLILLSLAIVVALASAVFFRRQRSRIGGARCSKIAVAIALVIAGAFGGSTAWALNAYESQIENFVVKLLGWEGTGSSRVGFTQDGSLNNITSWKTGGDDRVAVRVVSGARQMPGYLRGKRFERYMPRKGWTENVDDSKPKAPILNPPDLPEVAFGTTLFELSEPKTNAEETLEREAANAAFDEDEFDKAADPIGPRVAVEIWPSGHLPNLYFDLGSATHLMADVSSLSRDKLGNLSRDEVDKGEPYTLLAVADRMGKRGGTEGRQLADTFRQWYLRLPAGDTELETQLRGSAREVFGDAATFEEKTTAVAMYFHNNYTYELGEVRRTEHDFMVEFLRNAQSGHCELFATATVLLLRQAGIPARYVTGVVAREWNDVGNYWVARDRDAHAWAEAWDDAAGRWVIVESTPASGVPQEEAADGLQEFFDAARLKVWTWQREWSQRDVVDNMFVGLNFLARRTTLFVIAIAAGLLAVVLWLRQTPDEDDPELAVLATLRTSLERRLTRHGLTRLPTETVLDFAARVDATVDTTVDTTAQPALRDAATWLRDYARVRYRRSDARSDLIAGLSQRHDTLRRDLRRRSKSLAS